MAKLTITGALAEIKTTKARMQKKREAITRYLARDSRLLDPLEKEGGSFEYIRRERQALQDLEERIVSLRSSIQASNLASGLTINTRTRTVADWLSWRREVLNDKKGFTQSLLRAIEAVRKDAISKGYKMTESAPTGDDKEVIVAVQEKALNEELEALEAIAGDLDGKLSLANATTVLEV